MAVPMLFPTMGIPIDFRPIKTAISTQTELDVAIVLDRSGSMAFSTSEIAGPYNPAAAPLGWQFGHPVPPLSRWIDAITAADSFLRLLESSRLEERVSLSTYSSGASLDTNLTKDFALLRGALGKHTMQFNGGSTNIGDGILAGLLSLSDTKYARPWASV